MLEEPAWPEIPATRIYPDQPQGISRDDGEWVLGHKEFRYAVVPEKPGELVLPELWLDWWDTVANRQRTAVLPEHRLSVLPSEVGQSVAVLPPVPGSMTDLAQVNQAEKTILSGQTTPWKASTGAFALLWLLTLFFYYRRGLVVAQPADSNGSMSLSEKDLLKQFQQACQKGEASAARRALAQWIRNYAPQPMRGSMREFGASCGDTSLQSAMAELDTSGFANDSAGVWNGDVLWDVFKHWQNRSNGSQTVEMGKKPDLYPE